MATLSKSTWISGSQLFAWRCEQHHPLVDITTKKRYPSLAEGNLAEYFAITFSLVLKWVLQPADNLQHGLQIDLLE